MFNGINTICGKPTSSVLQYNISPSQATSYFVNGTVKYGHAKMFMNISDEGSSSDFQVIIVPTASKIIYISLRPC